MNNSPAQNLDTTLSYINKNRKESRILVALAGPPAAGKSTLAQSLAESLNSNETNKAAVLPMDGFHLDNDTLDARNLRQVKGAPQTFDAQGFCQLLKDVRNNTGDVIYPTFDRKLDQVIPNAATLQHNISIVIVEGNYLLLNQPPWNSLHALFDITILIKPSLEELEKRLVDRWLNHDHTLEQAIQRARGNDLVNAKTVLTHSIEADLVLR